MSNYRYYLESGTVPFMLLVPDGMGGYLLAQDATCCCTSAPILCDGFTWKKLTSMSATVSGFTCNLGVGACTMDGWGCSSQTVNNFCDAANGTFSADPVTTNGITSTGFVTEISGWTLTNMGCVNGGVSGFFCQNIQETSSDVFWGCQAGVGSPDSGATWQWYACFYLTSAPGEMGGISPGQCCYFYGPSSDLPAPVDGVIDATGTYSLPLQQYSTGAGCTISCVADGSPLSLTFT